MIILFRSCEANLSPGSLGDGKADKPRWNGKHKLEILRKCYLSIQEGLNESDRIWIINDRTSKDTLTWMRENTKARFDIYDIPSLDESRKKHPYPKYHPVIANSCTDMMEILLQTANDYPDDLIYVCEDDYLHTNIAINTIKALYTSGYSGFYVPYDYPDRYTIDTSKLCELYAGPFGHLRSVPSSTLTLAAKGVTWTQFAIEVLRSGAFADDTWTWKAFQQSKCLCPVPGHATHLQDGCITPFIDWTIIYDNIITS